MTGKRLLIYCAANICIVTVMISCSGKDTGNGTEEKHITGSIPEASRLYIDLVKTLGSNKYSNRDTITVRYDHFFKKEKRYAGIPITMLIDDAIKAAGYDTSGAIAVFECTDGYKPEMKISLLFGKAKGYITWRDLEQKGEMNWPDSVNEKFNPYYLVWDDVKKEDDRFAWPYGLAGIRLVRMEKEFRLIFPYKDTAFIPGFNLFRLHCMKCHSINKVGGKQGPEFNIPKNITEYWTKENIIAFAKKPNGYRANSRMQPVGLGDSALTRIVDYIQYMKNHKLVE